jgi:hypothetical protein
MKNRILDIKPVSQKDGYSCGFCAMKAVYRHYNLDTRRLRARLGTDNQPIPYGLPCQVEVEAWLDEIDIDARGTLPFDMMAVLHQDGFELETCADSDHLSSELRRSVRKGHPGLALVEDFSHWIVLGGIEDDDIWVVDSMENDPYLLDLDRFNGAILIRDYRPEQANDDFALPYAHAARFLLEMCRNRMGSTLPNLAGKAWDAVRQIRS